MEKEFNLTSENIEQRADTEKHAYIVGAELYKSGSVYDFTCKKDKNEWYLSATIEGSPVEVILREGQRYSKSDSVMIGSDCSLCTIQSIADVRKSLCYSDDSLCAHAVALLLCYSYGTSVSQRAKAPLALHVKDTKLKLLLMELQKQRAEEVKIEGTTKGSGTVHLGLSFYLKKTAKFNLAVKLTIGETKHYVIKKPAEFFKVHLNQTYPFSKNYSWKGNISDFEPFSQKIALLFSSFIKKYQFDFHESENGGLYLPNQIAVTLFDYFKEEKKAVVFSLEESTKTQVKNFNAYQIEERDPQFFGQIDRMEIGIRRLAIRSKLGPLKKVLPLLHRLYLFFPDTMVQLQEENISGLLPLLSLPSFYTYDYLSDNEVYPFMTYLLPQLKRFMPVQGREALDGVAVPEEPMVQLKIDIDPDDPFLIVAKLEMMYEKGSYDYFSKVMRERRNMSFENGSWYSLRKFFTRTESSVWPLELHLYGDDDFYEFLFSLLPEMEQYCTIFLSKKLTLMRKPQKSQVEVHLNGNGAHLNLDMKMTGISSTDLEAILHAYRKRQKFYRFHDGSFLPLLQNPLSGVAEISETLHLSPEQIESGHIALPLYRSFYLDKTLSKVPHLSLQRNSAFKALVRAYKDGVNYESSLSSSVCATLRYYQMEGFQWLSMLDHAGFGGLLADDMGLGKTLQMIALIATALERNPLSRVLIGCPASLVLNWSGEFAHFTRGISYTAVVGSAQEKSTLLQRKSQVLILSYEQIRISCEDLKKKNFDYFILDEAHLIKNEKALVSKAVKSIPSVHRFALSGTPIQNRITELWSLFDFILPGYLFTKKEFTSRFATGKEKDMLQLRKLVAPFILRRTKQAVLTELKEKVEMVRYVDLEGEQKKHYMARYATLSKQFHQLVKERNLGGGRIEILSALTKLRQLCCDPSLLYENWEGESSKLDVCMELVEEAIDGGHSVLLFSQFSSMLEIIKKRLSNNHIDHFILTGGTAKQKRQDLVERFQNKEVPVFLISLKAGGLGLNLTAADTVILYDPWWNRAAENQASDRANRMGQKKSVNIYRLICRHTLEEKILDMQEKKQKIESDIISENTKDGVNLQELKELFAT